MLSLLLGKVLRHIIQLRQMLMFQKLNKPNQTKTEINFYSSKKNFIYV